jgi:hypothetical protein
MREFGLLTVAAAVATAFVGGRIATLMHAQIEIYSARINPLRIMAHAESLPISNIADFSSGQEWAGSCRSRNPLFCDDRHITAAGFA